MDSGQTGRFHALADGCYPYGFVAEAKALYSLAWPTSLSILFHYLIQPISLMFCGHLGKKQLASAAMAISVIYMTCVSVGRGLAFGGDTFFSQTFGSRNKKMMGVYLQKSLIFGVFCAAIICGVLLNTETILLLLRQDPEVARLAQEYTLMFMPGALAYCWIFTLMRYLLCQNIVIPNLLVCVASCGANALLHYSLVIQAGMGIKGSAISLALTYYLVFVLLFAYIWGSGIYRQTWGGWSWECLDDWGPFSKVVLSSIFMTVIFWLCTEVGTFLAEDEDAPLLNYCRLDETLKVPLGIGGACTARVGQYLGANQPLGAITACRVSFTIQAIVSIVMGVGCYLLRWYIPEAFTSNWDVISYTADIMQLVAIYVLMEGTSGVGVSIARGTGRQTFGAAIIFISYYLFALPIGVPLMFATYLGLAGLWWGYNIGLAVQNVALLLFVARLDWRTEANNAQVRAGVTYTPSSVNSEESQPVSADHEPDVDENTRLLDEASADDVQISSSSQTKIVLSRLGVVTGVTLVVAALVAVRLFVHIETKKDWTELCLPTATAVPVTIDAADYFASVSSNVTLAPCNTTDSALVPPTVWAAYFDN